jgi:NitT/TauT family transport system substrate-binding protein
MPRTRNRPLFALLQLLVVALLVTVLAACGDDDEPAADAGSTESDSTDDAASESDGGELPTVVFQAFPDDPAGVPVQVMEELGIDEKFGFDAELLLVDPDAAASTFLLGESDIATEQDIVNHTIAQAEGEKAVAFLGVLNTMVGVVSAEGSGIDAPEDLVGARIGHFGVDSGTTSIIAVMLKELYDIDVFELDLFEAGPAALPELLANGEVDAIFNYEPLALRAFVQTPGQYVFEPAKAWAEATGGFSPWLTNLSAKVEWIEENPELAINVRDAFLEAMQEISDSDYEILREEPYVSQLGLADETELDAFVEYCVDLPCYALGWTEDDLAGAEEWLQLLVDNEVLITELPAEPVAVILEDFIAGL